MEIIRGIPEKSVSAVEQALYKITKEAGPLFSKAFKNITADNGSEFSNFMSLEKQQISKSIMPIPILPVNGELMNTTMD
jgi:IS30 family transposase